MTKSFIITPLLLLITLILFEILPIDLVIQDYFYDTNQQQWLIDKNNTILRLIFYDGIKILYIFFVLLLLISLVFFRKKPLIRNYQQGLLLVLISTISIPLLVSTLKASTNMPCPKDITYFGGNYLNITLFSHYPVNSQPLARIKCFPAGHASGGFALLSLFFLFKSRRNKIIALVFAFTLAWSIATYKMLIGDHFLSHTLVTMLLSWWIILYLKQKIIKS